jgi:hypothetical protein
MVPAVSKFVEDAAEPYIQWPKGAVDCLNAHQMVEVSTKQYAAQTEAHPGTMDASRQWMTWPCRIPDCNTLHITMHTQQPYAGGALLTTPIRVLLLKETTVPRILECVQHLATKPTRHIMHAHLFMYLLIGTYNITDLRYVPEGFLLESWRWIQRLCRSAMRPPVDGIEIPEGHVFLFAACGKMQEPDAKHMRQMANYLRKKQPPSTQSDF